MDPHPQLRPPIPQINDVLSAPNINLRLLVLTIVDQSRSCCGHLCPPVGLTMHLTISHAGILPRKVGEKDGSSTKAADYLGTLTYLLR